MMRSIQQFYQDCLVKFALMGLIPRLISGFYAWHPTPVPRLIGSKDFFRPCHHFIFILIDIVNYIAYYKRGRR